MENNDWDYTEKIEDLIESAQDAYDELVIALGEPMKLGRLGEDKKRAAIMAKKLTLVDAKEILQIMQELKKMIGKEDKDKIDMSGKPEFEEGGPEGRFKNRKPIKRKRN